MSFQIQDNPLMGMAARLQLQANQLEGDLKTPSQTKIGTYEADLRDIEDSLATLNMLMEEVEQTVRQRIIQSVAPVRIKTDLLKVKIQTLKQNPTAQVVPLHIQPPVNIVNRQAQFFYATHNQMADVYIPTYRAIDVDPANRRSACTMIAGQFVERTLCGEGPDQLDPIMTEGQHKMANSKADAGTIFVDVVGQFRQVELLPLTPRMLDINPVGEVAFDRQLGMNGFKAALELLREIKQHNSLPSIGAVLTNPPESYGLVIDNDGILFFDSHGDMPQQNGSLVKGPAYVAAFATIDEAAAFLAKRLPVMDYTASRSQERVNVDALLHDERLNLEDPLRIINMFPLKAKNPVKVPAPLPNSATLAKSVVLLTPPAPTTPQTVQGPSRIMPQSTVNTAPVTAKQINVLLRDMYNLMEVIDLLKMGEEGLFAAFGPIAELSKQTCMFPMTDRNKALSIGDRLFFHTYFIHKNEFPEKLLPGDHNYGTNAFQSDLATPVERVRTAQRTLIEVALTGMENAIAQNDSESLRQYLAVLEKLQLSEKDLPKGVQNIAHHLFGILYQTYLKASETDKSLIHPHDSAFNGDFGRHAFNDTAKIKIQAQYKLASIAQVRDQLAQVWKVG